MTLSVALGWHLVWLATLTAVEYVASECSLNTLCHCISRPNTSHIVQVRCASMRLYKFPELPYNSIKSVAIQNNLVQTVDDETFNGLALEKLLLDRNQLFAISDNSLRSMVNTLRDLDLSDNQLQLLPKALRRLRTLGRLSLHGNLLQSLDGDWSGLAQARVLRLSANSICQLSELHHPSNPTASDHTNNLIPHGGAHAIVTVTPHIISEKNTHKLPPPPQQPHSLALATSLGSNHSGHSNHKHSFAQLHRLAWLDLSANRIADLTTHMLPPSIVTLDLSHNILTRLPIDLFAALPQLKFLLLAGNLLESSPSAALRGGHHQHVHLEKLDLSQNRFRTVHGALAHFVRMPHNGTTANAASNSNGPVLLHVKAITLARNWLHRVDGTDFHHLRTQHLVLAFNRLTVLDANAFHPLESTLEYLDLEHNQLAHTHAASLQRLQRLQYLYFTANRLDNISDPLPSTLLVLSLAGNNLAHMPFVALQACTQITYLNVGYNQIADLGVASATADVAMTSSSPSSSTYPSTNVMDESTPATTTDSPTKLLAAESPQSSTTSTAPPVGFIGWAGALQTLLLRNNKLTELTAEAFTGLHAIREISLSFNDLHWMHPLCFAPVASTLQILELSFALRTSDETDGGYPMRQLRPLHQLVWLGLDNNRLAVLPEQAFATLGSLRYVNLAFNRIEALPAHLFDAEIHVDLVEVDLAYNRLTQLRPFAFDSCAALETITLAHNRLHTLQQQCFNNLPQLHTVDLSHNRLANISAGAFALLPNLQRLRLEFNELHVLELAWFRDVSVGQQMMATASMTLNVSHNRIEQMVPVADVEASSGDGSWPAIGQLDLSHNQLRLGRGTGLPGSLLHALVRTLFELRLNGNGALVGAGTSGTLTSRVLGDLLRLAELDLSFTGVSALRRRTFHGLDHVQMLNLSHNHITLLQTEQFSAMQRLRVLDLSGNRLFAVGDAVFARTRLEWLDVGGNLLTEWPQAALADVGFTLRAVDTHGNRIARLDRSMFVHTPLVAVIEAGDNQLGAGTGLFTATMTNLTRLELSGNTRLADHLMLAAQTSMLRSVRHLGVARVGLTVLPPRLVDAMPALAELNVNGNRLATLPPNLRSLRHLHTVWMAANRVQNWQEVVHRLPASLRTLDVSHTEVSTGVNVSRSPRCIDVASIRHLDRLHVIGFSDGVERHGGDQYPAECTCFWSNLRVLRVLHVSLSSMIRRCFVHLLGLEELYLVVTTDGHGSMEQNEINGDTASATTTIAATSSASDGAASVHLDSDLMPLLHENSKLRLLDLRGSAIGSIAANAFETLRDVHRLHVRLHDTGIVTLPGGLFYALHAVSMLTVDVSRNRRLSGLSPNVFYPNVSVWDAVGTRSIVGGLDVYDNEALVCDCGLVWLGHWLRRWLRETAQMNVVTREESGAMLERARRNGCTDPATGAYISFLDLFPEDLMCHASALSSSAMGGWWHLHRRTTQAQLLTVFLVVYIRL